MSKLGAAAALAFAGLAIAGALATLGGRWIGELDIFSHFAPIWLGAAALAIVLALALKVRRVLRVVCLTAGAVALIGAGQPVASEFCRSTGPSAPSGAGAQLVVVQFNAWGGNARPQVIVDWIKRVRPDIMIIAEPTAVLGRAIARQTGLHTWAGTGVLIASRQPPIETHTRWQAKGLPGRNAAISWAVFRGPDGIPFGVVGAHAKWPLNIHLASGEDLRIAAVIHRLGAERTILSGDFNSTPWSSERRRADAAFGLYRRDRAIPTWPARLPVMGGPAWPFPFLPIDHIYAGSAWRTIEVRRGPALTSDHYPLVARLTLGAGEPELRTAAARAAHLFGPCRLALM